MSIETPLNNPLGLAIAILLFAAIGMLIAIGLYVASRFRGTEGKDMQTPHDLLTKFRELHSQGELSDEEFRTIKSKLGSEILDEVKDSSEKG